VSFSDDVVVVGGCGHVGLPLGIAFAERGLRVVLYDCNQRAIDIVNAAQLPFAEPDALGPLQKAVAAGRLVATNRPETITAAEHVVIVIGTPVDEHLNPDPQAVPRAFSEIAEHLTDGHLIVLRSTIYPGVTALVERLTERLSVDVDVAFCPERIAEGRAMTELFELPQLVAARSPRAAERAEKLFRNLTAQVIRMQPEEAELAKLFTNVWRYIKFATANQFYMIANDFGLDYEVIRSALAHDYPRATDLPKAGFAAGPCLFKDTMQLAAFNNNNFVLGHASMMVNEGLPLYVVARLERQYSLANMTVGILGMAFKSGSDDIRSSLSYKLKRILRFKAAHVVTTDPYVTIDPELKGLDEVLAEADLLIVGAPHPEYRHLRSEKPVADIWGITGSGVRV
jgi:UDP-N-acetyl-D-mannosaminuronic acid dehydrogenase